MKRIILLFMFLGLLVSVSAQTTTNPTWKTYLEGYKIEYIAAAGNYLWLTNGKDVIKFDKNTGATEYFNLDNVEKSPNYQISSIACAENGLPLLGVTYTGLLKMNEDEQWVVMPLPIETAQESQAGHLICTNLLITENDVVWTTVPINIDSPDMLLVKYLGNAMETFETNFPILSLFEDNEGNLWLGKLNGIDKFDGYNWTTYNSPTQWEPSFKLFYNIIIDESGNKWMAGAFGIIPGVFKLVRFNGTEWQAYNLPVEAAIGSLALQDDSIIWLGTSNGLMKFSNYQWTVFDTENSELPTNYVHSVIVDDEGTKWLGTENGLVAFNENGLLSTANDSKLMDDVVLFPNPAKDFITLKLPQGLQNPTVDIFNILGKTIKTFSVNNQQNLLDVSSFPSGIYLVRIQSEENYIVKKFVKL